MIGSPCEKRAPRPDILDTFYQSEYIVNILGEVGHTETLINKIISMWSQIPSSPLPSAADRGDSRGLVYLHLAFWFRRFVYNKNASSVSCTVALTSYSSWAFEWLDA